MRQLRVKGNERTQRMRNMCKAVPLGFGVFVAFRAVARSILSRADSSAAGSLAVHFCGDRSAASDDEPASGREPLAIVSFSYCR
jgi:hypothetical protein